MGRIKGKVNIKLMMMSWAEYGNSKGCENIEYKNKVQNGHPKDRRSNQEFETEGWAFDTYI